MHGVRGRRAPLEAEDLVGRVAARLELGDGALDHGRRPAAEDVGLRPGRRHRLLEHGRVDEAREVRPVGRRLVERVVEVHGARRRRVLELLAAQDVALRPVAQQQRVPGRALALGHRRRDQLEHGRQARAPRDEAGPLARDAPRAAAVGDVEAALAEVLDLAERPAELDVRVERDAVAQVLGEGAAGREARRQRPVGLNHEVDVAADLVGRRRRVRARDHLAVAVLAVDEDVLAHGQAQHHVGRRQREAQPEGVVRQRVAQHELELDLALAERDAPALGVRRRGLLLGPGRRAGRAHDADAPGLELGPGLLRVDGLEVLGRVGARDHGDRLRAAGVALEVLGRVVDRALDDDPAVVGPVVLGDFGERVARLLGRRGERERLEVRRRRGEAQRLDLGQREAAVGLLGDGRRARRVHVAHGLLVLRLGRAHGAAAAPRLGRHPAARGLAGERRVLEREARAALGALEVLHDREPGVVEHAHDVPRELLGLRVHGGVPRAARHVLGLEQVGRRHGDGPHAPAPVLAGGRRRVRRVRHVAVLDEVPRLAPVERHLDADDLAAAAAVGVALDVVRLAAAGQVQHLAVAGPRDRGVDAQLVDDVVGLEPPALGLGLLGRHVHGQHAVVLEVVVVVRARVAHADLREPLDHAPADEAGDDDAHGEAVVRLEPLAVLLPADHDVVGLVHGVAQRHGRAVGAVGAGGQLLDGPAEADVAAVVPRRRVRRDAVGGQDVGEVAAAPRRHAEAGGAPVEADRALDHVLLLAAVARADEEHGPLDEGQLPEVRERERRRRGDAVARRQRDAPLSFNLQNVALAGVGDGDLAVVAHVVDRGRRGVAVRHEQRQRRLDVERVLAREAHLRGHQPVCRARPMTLHEVISRR